MTAVQRTPDSGDPLAEITLPPEAYRQAVAQADLAISITDPKANILFANEAFSRVTGYGKEEIVGKNEATLSNHTTPPELYKAMWMDLSAQKPWSGKLLNRRKDGELYLAELSISPVVDAGDLLFPKGGVTDVRRDQYVLAARTISRGGHQLTEALRESLQLSYADAQRLKETRALVADPERVHNLVGQIVVDFIGPG